MDKMGSPRRRKRSQRPSTGRKLEGASLPVAVAYTEATLAGLGRRPTEEGYVEDYLHGMCRVKLSEGSPMLIRCSFRR